MKTLRDAFVIMPFSTTPTSTEAEWTEIYENIFKPSLEEAGYPCDRAQAMTGSLAESIVARLRTARIVLADITDRNPNVFYELGIRHSLSKRTIIAARGSDHVPSDLSGYWFIRYGLRPGEVSAFKREIGRIVREIEKDPERVDSPVANHLERENLTILTVLQKSNAKRLDALAQGERLTKAMETDGAARRRSSPSRWAAKDLSGERCRMTIKNRGKPEGLVPKPRRGYISKPRVSEAQPWVGGPAHPQP